MKTAKPYKTVERRRTNERATEEVAATDDTLRVLLIEDNEADVRLIDEVLRQAIAPSFELTHVSRLADGIKRLKEEPPDLVLLDLGLPDSRGIESFQRLIPVAQNLPVVVLTALDDEELALKAVQLGAQDYLVKGLIDSPLFVRSILYAIERQRMIAKIQSQERELERDRARSQVFEIMAHELRNPMAVVKAILTLIRIRANRDETVDNLKQRIIVAEQELDRISNLLTNVLDAFRAEKVQLDCKWEPVDLVAVVEAAMKPFRASERLHRFLRADSLSEAWVIGDRYRLEQVVRNLLENATKFSPHGGTITITIKKDQANVALLVADEGLGLPEGQYDQVFDAFYKGSNVVPYDLGGLGLGLFICKAIVQDHGGRIWAQNNEEGGALFGIELPLDRSHSSSPSKPPPGISPSP